MRDLLSEVHDWRVLRDTTVANVQRQLDVSHGTVQAVQIALLLMDHNTSGPLAAQAAADLTDLFGDPAVLHGTEQVLYARPLSEPLSAATARARCAGSLCALLFQDLDEEQPRIRALDDCWQTELSALGVGANDREAMRASLVRIDAWRKLRHLDASAATRVFQQLARRWLSEPQVLAESLELEAPHGSVESVSAHSFVGVHAPVDLVSQTKPEAAGRRSRMHKAKRGDVTRRVWNESGMGDAPAFLRKSGLEAAVFLLNRMGMPALERDLTALLIAGLPLRRIASEARLPVREVQHVLERLYRRFGVRGRKEFIAELMEAPSTTEASSVEEPLRASSVPPKPDPSY